MAGSEVKPRAQLVQNRPFQAGDERFFRAEEVQDNDLVLAFTQPRAGRVGGLGRADVPEPAKAAAIDPDDAFTPGTEVEEGVGGLGQVKMPTPEGRNTLGWGREVEAGQHGGIQRQGKDLDRKSGA